MIGIYLITNKINGKQYVGQSKNIENRWQEHILRERNTMIHNAIKKYGVENFEFKVLEECSIDRLTERERYYYKKLKPKYNAIYPDDNPMNYDNIREKQKAAMNTEEFKQKMSEISKKNYNEELKMKLVESSHSKEAQEKRLKTQNTEEYKKKASEIHKKLWKTEEYRNKKLPQVRQALKDMKNNKEIMKKISDSSKERWKNEEYRNHIINETSAKKRKKVRIYNENEDITFASVMEASRWFASKGKNRISARVCISQAINGKHSKVYGYNVELL